MRSPLKFLSSFRFLLILHLDNNNNNKHNGAGLIQLEFKGQWHKNGGVVVEMWGYSGGGVDHGNHHLTQPQRISEIMYKGEKERTYIKNNEIQQQHHQLQVGALAWCWQLVAVSGTTTAVFNIINIFSVFVIKGRRV